MTCHHLPPFPAGTFPRWRPRSKWGNGSLEPRTDPDVGFRSAKMSLENERIRPPEKGPFFKRKFHIFHLPTIHFQRISYSFKGGGMWKKWCRKVEKEGCKCKNVYKSGVEIGSWSCCLEEVIIILWQDMDMESKDQTVFWRIHWGSTCAFFRKLNELLELERLNLFMGSWALNPSNQTENLLQVWFTHLLSTSEKKTHTSSWSAIRNVTDLQNCAAGRSWGLLYKIRWFILLSPHHVTMVFVRISLVLHFPQSEFRSIFVHRLHLNQNPWARVRWFSGP